MAWVAEELAHQRRLDCVVEEIVGNAVEDRGVADAAASGIRSSPSHGSLAV